jgi:uncharacterized protein
MLKLNIFEIPDGKSTQELPVPKEFLEEEDVAVIQGNLHMIIDRSQHMIHIKADVIAEVELICDRSMDSFSFEINRQVDIIFKEGLLEEDVDLNASIKRLVKHQQLLDLDQDVRDMILLSLPYKRIHPRFLDENGNITEAFDQQFGSTSDDEEVVDPRWNALKKLKIKY